MFGAQTLSPYIKLGSKLIFLVCLIVEGQEWVAGVRVSGGLSGQCCHWIIIGSAVSWSGGDCLKPALMAVLAPASVTFSYAVIALFCWGFLFARRHLCLSCSA